MISSDKSNGLQDQDDNRASTASVSSDKTAEKSPVSDRESKNELPGIKMPTQTQEFMKSRQMAANFGNIITILMQSPGHKDRKLSDMQNIVVPALVNNQFRISEAHKKGSGYTIPVGVILWARVSDEVDKRLSKHADEDIQLTAEEWISGDNIWIVLVVGEQRFVASLLKDLRQKDFKEKKVKYRRKTEKGIQIITIP